MTTEDPTAESELQAALATLLRRAHDNGVDVRGGWACQNGPEQPDWDVVVTEVDTDGASD
jgi:hypothetical protein